MSTKSNNIRVAVLGKGELAIKICSWFKNSADHILVNVVPVKPEPTWTGSLSDWAKENNVEVVESGHYRDLAVDNVDLVLSVFYDKIIKQDFIQKCKKIINLHNSPLPKYRGMSPINWALKDNRVEHGVTIHEITPGVDDGPVISQVKYSIYPEFEEVKDVYKKALKYAYTLFENTIPIIDKIIPVEQNEAESSYHHSSENYLLEERRYFTREISIKTMKEKK